MPDQKPTLDYQRLDPPKRGGQMRTMLGVVRAVLLLVIGASGFYSWLLWGAMSEANVTLGWVVTAFERSIAVFSISTICYCATFVIRKRRSQTNPPQQAAN